ncbi:hypothetical protein CVIRNUC_007591 [Coccomyxa viridis]|uniref:Uncharacterized protein n=1 Tax=Coccomyxa viridis TaxID=1274662 RepID=A0AAV1ICD8_9CHLO|nr:hypothetical protein CVIRNUC_007591 [Coccomyxa viridis]
MGDESAADAIFIPDTYPCPPGEYRVPHTEAIVSSKCTTITAFGRRYVGPHHDIYWFKGTPVVPGLRTTYPAFGQPAAKPVLSGVDEGSDGPVFRAQLQASDAVKICDTFPAKVLRRLKVQLQVASGTQLSAPALYGLGGGQHSVSAYLRKHCAPSPAFSRADTLQELAALHQQSLHSQW